MEELDFPPSVDLLNSMRSIGYTFELAVADLIDNSITAGASKILISLTDEIGEWKFHLFDDGSGMSKSELLEAMRLAGSASKERSVKDLGRFGLGLKTASLSQASTLSVISLKNGEIFGAKWDLEHVARTGRWSLQTFEISPSSLDSLVNFNREGLHSWTLVTWENLDLFFSGYPDFRNHVKSSIESLREHLALHFHRYIEEDKLEIRVNDLLVSHKDPFLRNHRGTQKHPDESFNYEGSVIAVRSYTLPHVSSLSEVDRELANIKGNSKNVQGFYIYRNKRLVNFGSWLSLASRDEFSKLARMQIDIPSALDKFWTLDVRKSSVRPPAFVKDQLRRILVPTLHAAKKVHSSRGTRVTPISEVTSIWNLETDRDGSFQFRINREHPILKSFYNNLDFAQQPKLLSVFRSLEDSFPVQDVYNLMAGEDLAPSANLEDIDDLLLLAKQYWTEAFEGKSTLDNFLKAIENLEPFSGLVDFNLFSEKLLSHLKG